MLRTSTMKRQHEDTHVSNPDDPRPKKRQKRLPISPRPPVHGVTREYDSEDAHVNSADGPKPKKRQKRVPTSTSTQVHTFQQSIRQISSWTSTTIDPNYIQVIYWIDVERVSKTDCAKRYRNKDGESCTTSNIFRLYNIYAPRFYAEKGVAYIPLGRRGKAIEEVGSSSGEEDKSARGRLLPVDLELHDAFSKLPAPSPASPIMSSPSLSPCPYATVTTPSQPPRSIDLITFICRRNKITYGPSNGPTIPLSSLIAQSPLIAALLPHIPDELTTIFHGPEITLDTISRLDACITPSLAPRLPTHLPTRYGIFEQPWTTDHLEDLYVFALCMGAWGVCDLVLDRWVEEVERRVPRVLQDEFGDEFVFDALEFGPEFLAFLKANDPKGYAFFLHLLAGEGRKGWERLDGIGLWYWPKDVKEDLLEIVRGEEEGIGVKGLSKEDLCARFHHHGVRVLKGAAKHVCVGRNSLALAVPEFPDVAPRNTDIDCDPIYVVARRTSLSNRDRDDALNERMIYADPEFNGHHDTIGVSKTKIRWVKEKLKLFKGMKTELSGEEANEVLGSFEHVGEWNDYEEREEDE